MDIDTSPPSSLASTTTLKRHKPDALEVPRGLSLTSTEREARTLAPRLPPEVLHRIFDFFHASDVFKLYMVCKDWQWAVDSKFTRPVIHIHPLHILDGHLYNVERLDGLSDQPGYNLLTKHHVVTHRESRLPWNIRGHRGGPGPKIERSWNVSWVYSHEKKRTHANSNPTLDRPKHRRSDSEVLQEFRRFETETSSSFACRVPRAFETEAAVYYKAPEPGEVELWTSKDIEELTFRGIEHIMGRHMLATKEALTTLAKSRSNPCQFLIFDPRQQGIVVPREQHKAAQIYLNKQYVDGMVNLRNLTDKEYDQMVAKVFAQLYPNAQYLDEGPRRVSRLPPRERETILHDPAIQKVLMCIRPGNKDDPKAIQTQAFINAIMPPSEQLELDEHTAMVVAEIVTSAKNGVPPELCAETSGETTEQFRANYVNRYRRINHGIGSFYDRTRLVNEQDLNQGEGFVQKHTVGLFEDLTMEPHHAIRVCWNQTTPDRVSHHERRDTSIYAQFQVADLVNPSSMRTAHVNVCGIEAKHGTNPDRESDFVKSATDAARSVRLCRTLVGSNEDVLETIFVLVAGSSLDIYVTREPFGSSGIAVTQLLISLHFPITEDEFSVQSVSEIVGAALAVGRRIVKVVNIMCGIGDNAQPRDVLLEAEADKSLLYSLTDDGSQERLENDDTGDTLPPSQVEEGDSVVSEEEVLFESVHERTASLSEEILPATQQVMTSNPVTEER
ncbi:hypothetical protein HDU93_007713 [Gonapodya sp. JEL0774]|nr:hypothetical protein HDU93_007713 [Gonapodya sp. JEL0774]